MWLLLRSLHKAYLFGRLFGAGLLVSLSLGPQQLQNGLVSRLLHSPSISPDQILPDLSEELCCWERIPATNTLHIVDAQVEVLLQNSVCSRAQKQHCRLYA